MLACFSVSSLVLTASHEHSVLSPVLCPLVLANLFHFASWLISFTRTRDRIRHRTRDRIRQGPTLACFSVSSLVLTASHEHSVLSPVLCPLILANLFHFASWLISFTHHFASWNLISPRASLWYLLNYSRLPLLDKRFLVAA
jgi:hypothetical protein